tara:strand:+ start:43 stop:642 length:600 start_codon:yes stop_codon:yes gene_type:complete
MNRLLLILILTLCFQSLSKADGINEFEIEGMSIGDSLLSHMNKNLIVNEINNKDVAHYYEDDFVSISTWDIKNKFKTYDDVGVVLKIGDSQHKIFALEGTLYMDENSNIQKCYNKQNEIALDIKDSLNLKNNGDTWFVKKDNLQKHQRSVKYIDYELKDGGSIRITCFEILRGVRKNSDLNLLYVVVNSSSFWNYLNSN